MKNALKVGSEPYPETLDLGGNIRQLTYTLAY
jgi:hypothetical protein